MHLEGQRYSYRDPFQLILSRLTVGSGSLEPPFDENVRDYTVFVPNATPLEITAEKNSDLARWGEPAAIVQNYYQGDMFKSAMYGTTYPYNSTLNFSAKWEVYEGPLSPMPAIADKLVILLYVSYKGTIGVTKITVTR